jgi:hypothetical protein
MVGLPFLFLINYKPFYLFNFLKNPLSKLKRFIVLIIYKTDACMDAHNILLVQTLKSFIYLRSVLLSCRSMEDGDLKKTRWIPIFKVTMHNLPSP